MTAIAALSSPSSGALPPIRPIHSTSLNSKLPNALLLNILAFLHFSPFQFDGISLTAPDRHQYQRKFSEFSLLREADRGITKSDGVKALKQQAKLRVDLDQLQAFKRMTGKDFSSVEVYELYFFDLPNLAQMTILARRFPNVKSLALINGFTLQGNTIVSFTPKLNQLLFIVAGCYPKLLKLRVSKLSKEALFAVVKSCSHLTDLSFDGLTITDQVLTVFSEALPNLQTLTMGQCRFELKKPEEITENWLPKLRSLDISYTQSITETAFKAIAKGLQSLRMHSVHQVTDAFLEIVAKNCPDLKSLDISQCENITSKGLEAIGENCHGLEHLNIACCTRFENIGFGYSRYLPGVDDKGLLAIAKGCPNLQSLDVHMCMYISNVGIKAIAEGCRRLRSLKLDFQGRITSDSLRWCFERCPQLDRIGDICIYPRSLVLSSTNTEMLEPLFLYKDNN